LTVGSDLKDLIGAEAQRAVSDESIALPFEAFTPIIAP
jgi:hypothetical protein